MRRPVALPAGFRRRLLKLTQKPSLQLEALKPHWRELKSYVNKEQEDIARRIPKKDPIKFPIDLLSPIGCETDENLHTQALAYILDEKKDHEFKRDALTNVIKKIKNGCRGSDASKNASKILHMIDRTKTEIDVNAECQHDLGRYDIRIELHNNEKYALVIIENKIDAKPGPDQLPKYRYEARKWCKERDAGLPLLVLLAREEPEEKVREALQEKGWVSLSYLGLASALRRSWCDQSRQISAVARAWLELYIATITSGVLEIDVAEHEFERSDIEEYLDQELPSPRGDLFMAQKLSIPAISHEADFYMRNWSTVDKIIDHKRFDPSIRELTQTIYDRAEQDIRVLLMATKEAFDEGVKGLLRVGELHRSQDSGEVWSNIFMPSGRKKRIASVGLYWDLDEDEKVPVLIGWVYARGGQAGKDKIMRACKHIQGLYKIEYSVVWFEKRLTPKSSRDELCLEIKQRAKPFFKTARAVLKELADKK